MNYINHLFYTPLEQFEVFLLYNLEWKGLDFSITNFSIFLFFILFFISFFLFFSVYYDPEFVPVRFQLLAEFFYRFILSILRSQVGLNKVSIKYFPLFLFSFLFILFSNLVGLIPYSFTVTSHIGVTFTLAFSINFGLIILGFYLNGFRFLYLFVPKGVPLWLLPLIMVIEFFSYLIRTFSLSIRLFTNMTAGHTLLHMVVSFSLLFLKNSYYFVFFISSFFIISIFFLEIGIAFIQAYVFIVLSIIYLNDSINPSH